MPVDPSDGERLARGVSPLVGAAEVSLIRLLTQAIADEDDGSGGWAAEDRERWANVKLSRLRFLRAQVEAGAATLARELETFAVEAVRQAYDHGAGLALADVETMGETAPRTLDDVRRGVPLMPPTLPADAAALSARFRAVELVTSRVVVAAYADAVAAGAAGVLSGADTRRRGSQRVLDTLARRGVTGFTDTSGRRWALDSYAEMSVRTVTGQAAVDGHVQTLQQAGLDLVQVSDSPRECPLCRPWEGKVLSLSGATGAVIGRSVTTGERTVTRVDGTLADARAAGLQHPNCGHRVTAYLPGASTPRPTAPDPQAYADSQRQRALERHVRAWKRREAAALDPVVQRAARAKVRAWQSAVAEHVETTGGKRLRYRESPLRVPSAP